MGMQPENRALAVVVLAIVVVAAVGGAYFLAVAPVPPVSLPIPAGTTFSLNDTLYWAVYFNVSTPDSRLVGAWTAFKGAGDLRLVVANGSVAPPGPYFGHCNPISFWSVSNGTIDLPVAVGPHTLIWDTFCAGASRIVVTEEIQLTNFGWLG
jgi:hypothetical protein